jgi:hypothetical protein
MTLLRSANTQIEQAAATLGIRPEDVVIEFEGRRFRYVKAFAIRPAQPLRGTMLEFGGRATEDALLRGYSDAAQRLEELARYAQSGGFKKERRVLLLQVTRPS